MNTLQQAIRLSRAIVAEIADSDLDKVNTLEKQRLSLIHSYYKNASNIDKKLTLELKQLNDEIVLQLIELKKQTRSQQTQLSHGNKMSKAYRANLP